LSCPPRAGWAAQRIRSADEALLWVARHAADRRLTIALRIRRLGTPDLTTREVDEIRALLWAAFAPDEHGGFDEDDWQHALGGTHFVGEVDGRIVAHAALVERGLHVAGRPLRTGYVEAVATSPADQRLGYGSAIMREVNAQVQAGFELGALGTGSHGFYQRLGWETWRGPTFVRTPEGDVATPDEDGYVLVLRTPTTPPIDLGAAISCEWRPGDVW
jgi:aminoglycoside 2'-N-acetyltransferase I